MTTPQEVATGIGIVGQCLVGYATLLFSAQAISSLLSEKIQSQEQLERVVEEEADILGLDKRSLIAKYYSSEDENYDHIFGARCCITNFEFEGHMIPMKVVEIKEGWGARRTAVRHELYHLLKHFPVKKNLVARFIRGALYEEPTAILYEITGIKV